MELSSLESISTKYLPNINFVIYFFLLQRKLRAPPLMNLVFANRKLSFYDTSNSAPSVEETTR